jgi:hypothetical protein
VGTTNSTDLLNKYSPMFLRDWNNVYHSMCGSATYNSGKELEIQLQSGSKLMPHISYDITCWELNSTKKMYGYSSFQLSLYRY